MVEKENTINKETFLVKYSLQKCFSDSRLEWDVLERIYQDYTSLQKMNEFAECCKKLEDFCREQLMKNVTVHSIRCRAKAPEHLIEKIIRKRGKEQTKKYDGINEKNYTQIVRDLIGLRILVIKKEDWEAVFDELTRIFPYKENKESSGRTSPEAAEMPYMAEIPVAYIRYGDRDIYKNKIKKEYSNKGYRSQHYVIKYGGFYCEIQVRTLAEEVFGEFDHLVKYPYRNDNNFLLRYTNTLSKLTDSIDEMMSTCFQINEDGWEQCAKYFPADEYSDWKQTAQSVDREKTKTKDGKICKPPSGDSISIRDYCNEILLRKGN
ncbi:MAG: hypothetical protein K2P87_04345 [Lachnospiraceae bacterium]|nr:hypothetical protein [Lachnospiraceae bacterium]